MVYYKTWCTYSVLFSATLDPPRAKRSFNDSRQRQKRELFIKNLEDNKSKGKHNNNDKDYEYIYCNYAQSALPKIAGKMYNA